jgi:isoleucyl-tRNA synthetase
MQLEIVDIKNQLTNMCQQIIDMQNILKKNDELNETTLINKLIKKSENKLKQQEEMFNKKLDKKDENINNLKKLIDTNIIAYTKQSKKIRNLVWNKYIGEDIGSSKCLCCKSTKIYQSHFHCGLVQKVDLYLLKI